MSSAEIKILVVEDDEDFRETVCLMIEDGGFLPVKVSDARKALQILESNEDISLVVTDINMAGLDGARFIESIRSSRNSRIQLLPIIAISGSTAEHEANRLLALGTSYFLQKPFGIQNLHAHIKRALGIKQRR